MGELKPIPFGRYCIFKKINKGGMAEIFLSRSTDKRVGVCVLKMLLPELSNKDNFIHMFITEGKIGKLMNHPNVVRSYELGRVQDKYFIAMEYITGKDLHHLMKHYKKRNQPVPIPMAVYIIRKVMEALEYAHNLNDASGVPLNLVNRDVSPTNILVTYDGTVKLIDFGIAQTVIGFTSQIGRIKGKICYMSPEQVRGLPLDHRSDLFSAVMVLYEMITGVNFYADENEFNQMERIKKVDLEPPSKLNPKVDAALESIIFKSLHPEPGERYQRTIDVANDLLAYAKQRGLLFTDQDMKQFMSSAFLPDREEEEQKIVEIMAQNWPSSTAPPVLPSAEEELDIEADLLEEESLKPEPRPVPKEKVPLSKKQRLMIASLGLILLGIVLVVVLITR